ncbi:MAG: alpha/beta hydrolase [Allomuricauda sp.]
MTGIHGQQRYLDSIFSKIKLETLVYSDTLLLDFYASPEDTVAKKPLIMLVHGGGFASGKRNNPFEQKFCMDMAQRGYAVASISYHLTRKGKSFGCDCPAIEKVSTFQSVSEDVLLATQYLVQNHVTLGFDANNIILVGSSAGAEAVLNTIFMKNHKDFKSLPYGQSQFAGVISFAGAVINVDYITKETAVPTMLFHGVMDRLVPYDTAPHHYCAESMPGYLMLNGSKAIAQKLRSLCVPYTLCFDEKGNHDWANLAYNRTDDIAKFVKSIILDGIAAQSEIRLIAKNQK